MVATGPRRSQLELDAAVRYRSCPSCGQVMNRKNFGRRSGVIVDVCTTHGVWFDPGELTAVLEFVASGGLAESRRRDLEDARAELRRRRAEALEQQIQEGRALTSPIAGGAGAHSAGALLTALLGGRW